MGPGKPFLLGLDYQSPGWPSFDHGIFEQLLEHAASLGLGALRLPLTWAEFQPDSRHLSDRCLRDLEAAMNTTAAYGLGLIPVLFSQGGTDRPLPSWVSKEGEEVLEGQLLLLRVVVSYFRGHRALRAWELDARSAQGLGLTEAWGEVLLPAARGEDPNHSWALGLTGEELLREDRSLLQGLASPLDFVILQTSGDLRLAPEAYTLAWKLARKKALMVLGRFPKDVRDLEEGLARLHQAGALGVFLPDPGSGNQLPQGVWEELGRAAAGGWMAKPLPYESAEANWQALSRRWSEG